MKFPVPKTLRGALSPTLLINWIFGIGVAEYPIGRPRPMISACSTIVNLVVFLGSQRMANLSQLATFQNSKMAARSYQISFYFYAAFIISSICIARINAKVVNGIFPKLTAINDRLNILGISNNYESVFKTQIIQLTFGFSLIFTIMGLDFKYVGHDFPSELSRISYLVAAHYLLIFAFIVDCTFSICIRKSISRWTYADDYIKVRFFLYRYLGNRFRRLNELFIETNSLEKGRPRDTWRVGKQYLRYPSVVNGINQYDPIAMRAAKQRWLLYLIIQARKIHRGLCKTAMELNRACGVQVLLSFAFSFGLIITLLYLAYNRAMASSKNRPLQDNWGHVINILLWNTFCAMRILIIVDVCETTSCEANRTGQLISTLLDTAASDEGIRDQVLIRKIGIFAKTSEPWPLVKTPWNTQMRPPNINIFSLQLIQKPLNFTASGFFTINYSLVCGIIGSVTTYLVIMIQMRSIYEPEDKISTPDSTMPVQLNITEPNRNFV